jgi:hypothetical protein
MRRAGYRQQIAARRGNIAEAETVVAAEGGGVCALEGRERRGRGGR